MIKNIKIRLKYLYTFSIVIIATIMNWMEIPIQDNWVELVVWFGGFILVGFSVKKYLKYKGEKE